MSGNEVQIVFWIFAWVVTGVALLVVVSRWHAPRKRLTLLRDDYKFQKYEKR